MDSAQDLQESDRLVGNSPLLGEVRDHLRRLHYSIRTETAYLSWIKRYILFHGKRHPQSMGEAEIERFLNHLAVVGNVAASTQNQALNALVFLYRKVLGRELAHDMSIRHAKRPERLPSVFERDEVRRILSHMTGQNGLIARLLYGTGMRLLECLRLRVQDILLERRTIAVRSGKGDKDRMTVLPAELIPALKQQIRLVEATHRSDLADGYGEVYLPYALDEEVSQRQSRAGLAISLLRLQDRNRPPHRQDAPSSPGRLGGQQGAQVGHAPGGNSQERILPYAAPQFRHASA